LWNLIENAIRFTSQGEVVVHLACDRTGEGPSTIVFGVRDSGMGISLEEQARLFDPFAQIENSLARTHEGLGLGLSTAKRLVERMDGRITVDSQLGKGSLFTIAIPMEIVETPVAAEMAQ
jgi:signal transduction histidine kinase